MEEVEVPALSQLGQLAKDTLAHGGIGDGSTDW